MDNRNCLNMLHLDDDPILVSHIPRVKDLCHALGLKKSARKFGDSLISWRKDQRIASGISGMDLTSWASKKDRFELGVMALHYLETGGHARKSWPSPRRESSRKNLEYPTDKIQ